MKKSKTYILYAKSILIYAFILLFIVLMVLQSKESVMAVKNALVLCYKTIIPSLFPFFVLSGLLLNTGFISVMGNVLAPVMKPLFGVSGNGAIAFVIGIVSGYPMGAVVVSQLYEKGLISETETQKLLPFCNNSGPLFIIGAVGVGMFQSVEIGMFLYLVHVVSALLVGLCFRLYGGIAANESKIPKNMLKSIAYEIRMHHTNEKRGFGRIFSDCVQNAVKTTLNICGFVALFSSFLECIKPAIDLFIQNNIVNLIAKGMLEITIGINSVANQSMPVFLKMILVSVLVGWGGVCVFLQVLGAISHAGISAKTYVTGKCLHALISGVLAYILLVIFGMQEKYVFAQQEIEKLPLYYNSANLVFLIFLIARLYMIFKMYKRKRIL